MAFGRRRVPWLLVLLGSLVIQVPDIPPCFGLTVIQVGEPKVVLPPRSFGLRFFPDGSMFTAVIDGKTYYFAASGGGRISATQGTIVLTGTLDSLVPLMRDGSGAPMAGLHPGFGGSNAGTSDFDRDFDRDYAGGGPVVWDPDSVTLLHLYHAEYHFSAERPFDFYSSLGLAISKDKGRSFQKLGLVIRPALPPTAGIRTPSSAGSLVLRRPYLYVYYSDISADRTCDGEPSGELPCVAVARANMDGIWASTAHNSVEPWKKFYRGAFAEPGIGGKFSPLFVAPPQSWARWPVVRFDEASGLFIMVYATGDTGLEIRDSRDGLRWSQPVRVLAARPDEVINYPSILDARNLGDAGTSRRAAMALTISYVSLPRFDHRIDFTSRSLLVLSVNIVEH